MAEFSDSLRRREDESYDCATTVVFAQGMTEVGSSVSAVG
jgi:hypothetical protein